MTTPPPDMPTLRPYQTGALDAIVRAREGGLNRLLVKKPTGCGKTVTFAAMLQWPGLKAWLETFPKTERKMLVIAHREELLFQAAEKIQRANPELIISIEQADMRANRHSDVVVASIQTLAARKFTRLHRLLQQHVFRIVIVDEAHHAAAPTYRTALVHLGFLPPADASESTEAEAVEYDDVDAMQAALKDWDARAPQDRLLIGMTATPNRTDAIGLGCVFQTIAYSYELKVAIDDKWLVPITPWVVETDTSLDDVRINHGDFNQRDLADTVNTDRRNQLAVAAWKEHAYGRSTLAFTVDVAHARDLATAFNAAGIEARYVSGETPKFERRDILTAYTRGDVTVVTNCMVLTEGTDLPRTGCILHAKPTKSATLYEQMTGRGLRIHPGKTDCIIIDVVDVARRHSLQSAPVLYGLPPGVKSEGQTLEALSADLEAFMERYPNFDLNETLKQGHLTLKQLHAKAETFNIWTVPSLGTFGVGRSLNWLKVGADTFRLQYPWADGTEVVTVGKDMLGHWEISLTLRSHTTYAVRQRTLAVELPTSDAAAVIAEAFVAQERRTVMRLKDPSAAWRRKPASERQLALLDRRHVPHPKTLTMGEASELIDLSDARRGR